MLKQKWLRLCNWRKFNYYEGSLFDVKAKMATIIEKTNYFGIKCSVV